MAAAPEIAIAGRSNVGKSTLLNRLAGRKGLARTSKTPGRTRGLVMFSLRFRRGREERRGRRLPVDELRLIDLPGYGYAKVSQSERSAWQPLIEGYTRTRRALALFVILIDARRGIEDEERQLYEWLGTENVPAQIVFTKVDKLTASARGVLRERARASFRGGRAVGGAALRLGRDGRGRRRALGGDLRGGPRRAVARAQASDDGELAEGRRPRLASFAGNSRTWPSTSCPRPSTSSR